jgi:hypothetical protein
VRWGDVVVAWAVAVVHPVHVGGELDPAPARGVNEPEVVRADRVPAQVAGLVPALVDHVVGADDHLVDSGDLPGGVVHARPVRPVAEQQRVVVGVAGGAQELADLLDPLAGGEAEPVGVEGDGLFLAGLGDVQRDVDQSNRPHPAWVAERLVPALDVPSAVPGRVLAALPLDGLAHRESYPEAGLVNGVRLTVGPGDLAVGGQLHGQVLE